MTRAIRLQPVTRLICGPIRRHSTFQIVAEKIEMARLLVGGIVEPSTSKWATHNAFVRTRDVTFRTTTHFRMLTAVTVSDTYAMRGMGAAKEWPAARRIFTIVDLMSGFFQIDLHPDSQSLTAVRTFLGLLQYTRLSQGLRSAPVVCGAP
jgi:hypothetical protein